MPDLPLPILGSIVTAPAMTPIPMPLDPALLPAGILLITGIFMLLAGRRLLKVGLGITGAVIGSLIGNAAGLSFTNALPPIVWTFLGGCIGLGIGLLLWRLTVASIMAASCAAVAVLAVTLGIRSGFIQPVDPGEPTTMAAATEPGEQESPDEASPSGGSIEDALLDAVQTRAEEEWKATLGKAEMVTTGWLDALNRRLTLTAGRLSNEWNGLSGRMQSALAGVALLGGLFGFLFGLAAWKRSGAIVTVVAGAGLVLIGSLIGYESLFPSAQGPFETLHPAIWLLCWFTLAAGGALIQWHAERQGADTESAAD